VDKYNEDMWFEEPLDDEDALDEYIELRRLEHREEWFEYAEDRRFLF
jgi:hypothetical protein